ncbi:PAS domain S-box protein [Nocardioides anomalus]|uniref:histidine kinase n=1 Tax=Nocardioides anomalus TaxID=2712223 RepID=A0A6G6WES9_9ACTN|nr:ATP-binding protein [Nocardioides anomalus]QIG43719.1 PAS domain S-box protein [Nocardioides anomalus]
MSTRLRAAVVAALLALMVGFGIMAVTATPEGGRGIGIWPVALATATLMLTRRPRALWWLPALAAVGVGTLWASRPFDVALGLGLGLSAEAGVTWWIASQGRRERAALLTIVDLSRFLLACTAGALTMAVVSAITSAVTGWGTPWLLALTTGTSSLAAQVALLPFFCRFRIQPPIAGPVERAAQWTVLLAVTVAVMVPTEFPSLALLIVPVLAWGALRNGSYEAMAQMAVAVGLAMPITTAGHGPFARPDERFGVPVDMQGILLATFAVVCALVVLTLRITVGEAQAQARQVAAERDRLRNVVDGITSTAIIGADVDGTITLFNPGAERLLGYDATAALGQSTRMLHSEASVSAKAAELDLPDDYSSVAAHLMGLGPTQMGFRRHDGEERQHQMSLNRVRDDRGEAIGYVSTSEDVTDRLRAEAALVEALETERKAVEQLREVDRVKDAFVSSVSHELRTPITSILGYTELLEEGALGPLTQAQSDAVDRISRNSSRLLSLISELLTLGKVHAAELPAQHQLVDLNHVVAAALAVLSPTVARRDVELTVDLPAGPVTVRGDRDMLERVVLNLSDNALKFTPDGGSVRVSLTAEADRALLEVADTGIGVPAHEQERLFDRFFRSSLAQHHAIPGSGLGLSIAKKIVEQHGGALEVESEAGTGSTFRVCLPL